MPDQAGLLELGQDAEVLGHRLQAALAQVDEVEVVAAEGAQVGLDERGQLVGPGQAVAVGPTFVAISRSSGYGASASRIRSFAMSSDVKSFRGPVGVGEARVEGRGVEVVDARARPRGAAAATAPARSSAV